MIRKKRKKVLKKGGKGGKRRQLRGREGGKKRGGPLTGEHKRGRCNLLRGEKDHKIFVRKVEWN